MTRPHHGPVRTVRMQGRPPGMHTVFGVVPVPLAEAAWPGRPAPAHAEETLFEWPPIDIDGGPRESHPAPDVLASLIRRLTPEQGITLTVRLGDASALLLPQLGSPERVAPSHRVPCRADIFSTPGGFPWEEIVAAVAMESEAESPLSPLTPALAGRLGLARFLRSSAPVLALSVLEDPTSDPRVAPERPVRHVGRSAEPAMGRSRDDAVAEARQARRRRRSLWGRLRGYLAKKRLTRERRAWFAAITPHPLPAQLWEIAPTSDLLLDGAVRRWVRDSAALLGASAEQLVKEWEIHWRRRGL